MRKKLLVESAEFISKVKVSKELKESLEMSAGKTGTLIIKNIPCTLLDRENQNGRIYSTEVLQEALQKAKPQFAQKQLLSQADEHPESSFVAPTHASHVVINAYIKPNVLLEVDGEQERDNVLFMDWEILNTEEGKNLRALFEAECSIGTSIRGLGDMNGNMVENYDLLGCDCVGNPSSSTYTRMPINESVQVEFKKENDLKETFTVSSSSTTTTRDLDQAEQLIRNVDEISFGTVTKTQTKFDRENDPKTGAETTITHVEIETSNDESDLNAALLRAKNALTNPVVGVDSVTIENVKDEDKKEATTYQPETPLKEEEPSDTEELNTEYVPETEISTEEDYVPTLQDADREYISDLTDEDIQTFINNWNTYNAGEKDTLMKYVFRKHKNEANGLTEAEAHEPIHYLQLLDGTILKQYTEDDIKKLATDLRNAVKNDPSIINTPAYTQARFSLLFNPKVNKDYVDYADGANWGLNNEYMPDELKTHTEEAITEAKKDKEKEEEKPARTYVLKAPAGFIGMNGNAITFEEQPKDAIHFLEGKEESGVIHLSGIQKILDTMGVYEVEKYYRVAKNNLNAMAASGNANSVEVKEPEAECAIQQNVNPVKETKLTEENGSNTKYSAKVTIDNANGSKVEDIPVSATEMDAVISEVANLYDMKSQREQGVSINVTDTQTGQVFVFNPETRALDPVNNNSPAPEIVQEPEQVSPEMIPTQESTDGELKQDDNKLEIDVDDDTHIEKEFENPVQASVVKAGIEQGKIGADVMLSEADDEHTISIHVEKNGNRTDGNPTYNAYFFNGADRLDMLQQLKDDIDSILPDWGTEWGTNDRDLKQYVQLYNVTENQLNKVLDGLQKLRHFEFGWDDGVGKITSPMDEKLYSEPTAPSDPLETSQEPLKDSSEYTITLSSIDYNIDNLDDQNLEGDLNEFVSLVDQLPNTVEVKLDKSLENDPNLLDIILQKAREQTGLPIRNATVIDVQ